MNVENKFPDLSKHDWSDHVPVDFVIEYDISREEERNRMQKDQYDAAVIEFENELSCIHTSKYFSVVENDEKIISKLATRFIFFLSPWSLDGKPVPSSDVALDS